jgi:hypothetical protein
MNDHHQQECCFQTEEYRAAKVRDNVGIGRPSFADKRMLKKPMQSNKHNEHYS